MISSRYRYPPITVTALPWLTVDHRYGTFTTVTERYRPLLTVTDRNRPLLTVTESYRYLRYLRYKRYQRYQRYQRYINFFIKFWISVQNTLYYDRYRL